MKLFFIFWMVLLIWSCKDQHLTVNDRKVITSDQIAKKIEKGEPLYFKDYHFTEDLDFTKMGSRYVLGKGMSEALIKVPMVFENCVFEKKITSYASADGINTRTRFEYGLSFEGCQFDDEINLSNAVIMGQAFWRRSLFRKDVNIRGIDIRDLFSFNKSVVEGDLQGHQIKISSTFDCFELEVLGNLFFQGAEFGGDCIFSNIKIHGTADLTLVEYRGDFFTNYSEFKKQVWFNRSVWWARAEFLNTQFQDNCHLKNATFYVNPRFDGAEFNAESNLEGTTVLDRKSFQLTH